MRNEDINTQIGEAQRYARTLNNTLWFLLDPKKCSKEFKGKIEKQSKLLSQYLKEKKGKRKYSYYRNFLKNLDKIKDKVYDSLNYKRMLEEVGNNQYNNDNIIKIAKKLQTIASYGYVKRTDAIKIIFDEYCSILSHIEHLKNQKELASTVSKITNTTTSSVSSNNNSNKEVSSEDIWIQKKYSEQSNILINGPKGETLSNKLTGKTPRFELEVEMLYELAEDILSKLYLNLYSYSHVPEENKGYNLLLGNYNSIGIEDLLNTYERIRKKYYNKYKKLNKEKKTRFQLDNCCRISSCNFVNLKSESKKIDFPPSKQDLINIFNKQVLSTNFLDHGLCCVHQKGDNPRIPDNYKKYEKTKELYIRLTRFMNIEQIVDLYKKIIKDIDLGMDHEYHYDAMVSYKNMNKMLICDVLFERKEIQKLGYSPEEIISKIMEKDEKNLKNDPTKSKDIQKMLEKEYVKYRAQLNLEGEKKHLSFREFAKQKYYLEDVEEIVDLENMVQEEIKRNKKRK